MRERYSPRFPQLAEGVKVLLCVLLSISMASCGGSSGDNSTNESDDLTDASAETGSLKFTTKAALGEALFSEKDLSNNRTQSCATCHNPQHAFIDNRLDGGEIPAVSVGDDGFSIGDRNAPTASYANLNPPFQYGTRERFNSPQDDYVGFLGGQFHDGRVADLKGQAEGPPLNPIEMNLVNKQDAVDRILENEDYEASFKAFYGDDIFDNIDLAYAAMADSIAAFEKTDTFSPFDSKYDRSLTGNYELTLKEALGKSLFFSTQFTSCATCHQLNSSIRSKTETFTGYEYHNIGVPVNQTVRDANGAPLDQGLLANPAVDALSEQGKFKTPTLRNVAVTEPYMHNGVFRDLETVIKFYDHFLTGSTFTNNPETGLAWRDPEFADTVSEDELKDGDTMTQNDVEAMVCFLRTLTDAKYEHLIQEKGISCAD